MRVRGALDANAGVGSERKKRAGEKESLTPRRDGRRGLFNLVRGGVGHERKVESGTGPTRGRAGCWGAERAREHTPYCTMRSEYCMCTPAAGCVENATLMRYFLFLPLPAHPHPRFNLHRAHRGRRESLTLCEARKFRVSAPSRSHINVPYGRPRDPPVFSPDIACCTEWFQFFFLSQNRSSPVWFTHESSQNFKMSRNDFIERLQLLVIYCS